MNHTNIVSRREIKQQCVKTTDKQCHTKTTKSRKKNLDLYENHLFRLKDEDEWFRVKK